MNDTSHSNIAHKMCPEENANPLSSLLLTWAFPLIYQGSKAPLQDADLWQLPESDRALKTSAILRARWREESTDKAKNNRLSRAIFSSLRASVVVTFVLRFLELVLTSVTPIFVNRLLISIEGGRSSSESIRWCFPILGALVLKALVVARFNLISLRCAMRVRASLQGLIYEKSLRISPSSRASCSLGQIVNLMQLDTQRIGDFVHFSHKLWFAPSSILISSVLLYIYLGPCAAIGLFGTFLAFPLQIYLAKQQAKVRRSVISISDRRVKLMNEILQGIRAIKMYAWEGPFEKVVRAERTDEVKRLTSMVWIRSSFVAVMMSISTVVGVIMFSFYTAVFRKELVVSDVFTGIALLNELRTPINMIPSILSSLIDARLGVRRIESFLGTEEISLSADMALSVQTPHDSEETIGKKSSTSDDGSPSDTTSSTDSLPPSATPPSTPVYIKSGWFMWGKASEETAKMEGEKGTDGQCNTFKLRDINLAFNAGELVAIVGHIASGKSSLLHAILGEMRRIQGDVALHGNVAYVSQSAWILNGSVRANILFGRGYDAQQYQRALELSALDEDLRVLPAGDATVIGERGINLSGGQKQRVSIARALYSHADVYLFDDSLSALDTRVGKHIFDQIVSRNGELKDKLRLLVTNQMHCLPHCDRIIVLREGRVAQDGPFSEVSTSAEFQALTNNGDEDGPGGFEQSSKRELTAPEFKFPACSYDLSGRPERGNQDMAVQAGTNLIQDEDRRTGHVNWRTYLAYVRACGGACSTIFLFIFWCISVVAQVVTQWWLSHWATEAKEAPGKHGLSFYLGIYFGLASFFVVINFLRALWFFTLALQGGKRIHNDMLSSVLHAPISFFDTNPVGRILARFSRDVNGLDELLPQVFQQMMIFCLVLIISYVAIGVLLPRFVYIAIPIGILCVFFQRFFNHTSVELKRLDSISKSPIYAHFSETLGGLTTLRAYGKQEEFCEENIRMIDINQRALFCWIVAKLWFILNIELVGAFAIFMTAFFGVRASDGTNSGDISLAIVLSLQVAPLLGNAIKSVTDIESQMNVVERTRYYCEELPEEAPREVSPKAPDDWPTEGRIEITGVSMRYRDSLPHSLRSVNVHIRGGENIGVVGRTGSGKSSLMIALLRLVEISDGSITVDGVDLATLGLNDVRKRITIIPQDPVTFGGTIRFNLDPAGVHSDAELWDALEKSYLKSYISGLQHGLDSTVSEYGENMSLGQRQLVCLTRALLRQSKILIMDEASSALDMDTDRLIQGTIRKYMSNATILTIAHRLFTLVDYDRILVMQDGTAVEFDTPEVLLSNQESVFSTLVRALGPHASVQFTRRVSSGVHSRIGE